MFSTPAYFVNVVFNMKTVWLIFISYTLVYAKCTAIKSTTSNLKRGKERKGCIVTLAFGHDDIREYNKTVVKRNKSVQDHLYTLNIKKNAVADVIIFHEGNIIKSHQDYIQSKTPEMPIIFVNISKVFQDFHFVSNPLCPPSILSDTKNTPPGYNSMCYFWFIAFKDYLQEYDWMLRFDAVRMCMYMYVHSCMYVYVI